MGMIPWHIAVVPDGSGLYITNRSMMSPRVSYINFSDGNVTQIESSEFDFPHGIGISSDGSKVFVSSSAMMTGGNSYLHIINTSINEVESSILLGEGLAATGLAVMQTTCENCD
jgi:DNA-binding beta-propeller fold protein YncE